MSLRAVTVGPQTTAGPSGESAAAAGFIAAGGSQIARKNRNSIVGAYIREFTDLTGWASAPVAQRLSASLGIRGLIAYLLLATARPAEAHYVRSCRSAWGHHATLVYPNFADTFERTAATLGFTTAETRRQWGVLAKVTATTGISPEALDPNQFGAAVAELTTAHTRPDGRIPLSWSTPLHGLKATLAGLGVLPDAPPGRLSPSSRTAHWDELAARAPRLVATMRRYLTQVTISMRPGSVALIDTTLRHLAVYLIDHHPDIAAVAEISRTHIEGFKTFLTSRVGYRSNPGPAKTTIGMRLGHLRSFFDRIIEWDYSDAPTRNPVFAGDMPIRDRPLPRFLCDADASALLRAARTLPDEFDRLAVEVLARTGLRKGEFLGLTRDAITDIGSARWLRTPVGKLHTDRYIPLHPRVDELLTHWLTAHPAQPGSTLMFTDRGRPIPGRRVDNAVQSAARTAGIGHVTPHQLRHTLATQAINNGMSLEAIAALLGHTSMSMTMTYARISDRTVADEYFSVTTQVENLYAESNPSLPAEAEGPNMRRLRGETTRLLGNGHCTRPAALDCRYETICETCTHFATTEDHRQILANQLANATERDEPRRKTVYLELLTRLDRPRT
ncbi:tyrosine-type recombinase/integrase [Mycolicibacterium sp.]|uniref:tyrosine-type recombinase/integrase n=1 Tax=Mycolicibacterium sp. TaxID=2320850 RepID=UPI001E019F30|nr:tyrosine-type recombinase/integrase [Mycolicibacterium sp.]MCB1292541.1 tyrosine-type recombinase/integrase [Mycobacterium sp.]MCB9409569.1 tyrosine-type recombinase/integrase [Mycolicibacterium sp.]